jgi:ABC-2 type transport system ATP-binding protein
MGRVAVEVRDLSKKFYIDQSKSGTIKGAVLSLLRRKSAPKHEFWGLKDINLKVMRGETLGIIGTNGSGKTSLLRILAGIVFPTSGEVIVNGKVSTLFELGTGFHPELTGRENIYLSGSILGMSKAEIDEKFENIVKFSELEQFIDTPLKHYSSGMQVRLAFSVSISIEPEVLLVDEVLAVGDAEFQSKSFSIFQNYKKKGATIVFVSHDLNAVKTICDRVALINKGSLVKIGKPADVVDTYNKFVSGEQAQHAHFSGEEGKRFGDGKARVEKIWLEEAGKETKIVATDKLSIRMRCKFLADSENPIFGIIMKDKEGRQILVTNTLRKNVKVGSFKKNQEVLVSFEAPNVFESGYYSLSPAISYSDGRKFYDWRTDCLEIFVEQLYPTGGLVNPPHKIFLS